MPLYEYKCNACGSRFEKLVIGSNEAGTSCSSCGSADVCKQFSSFGFSSRGRSGSGGGCTSCSSTNCSSCGK